MFLKKRHRDKIKNMLHKNLQKVQLSEGFSNQDTIITNEKEIPTQNKIITKAKDIPGFYFDYEKNRYFPIKNTHTCHYSDFINERNKTIIKNKKFENVSLEMKTSKIKQKTCESSINDIPNDKSFSNISIFNIIRQCNKTKKIDLTQNVNLLNKLDNYKINNLLIKEIKQKIRRCKYSILQFDGHSFILTLETIENETKIYIEKIFQRENVFETTQVREISLKYRNRTFNNFKVLDNILILITNFEIFFVQLNEVFSLKTPIIYYHDFKNNFYGTKNIPILFEWPIIKLNNPNEFVVSFFKKIYRIKLPLFGISKKSNIPETYQYEDFLIDLDFTSLTNTNSIHKIKILQDKLFKESLTELVHLPNLNSVVAFQNQGNIHILNEKFDTINLIKMNENYNPIINSIFIEEFSIIASRSSNCDIILIDLYSLSKTKIYSTKLKNHFDITVNLLYIPQLKVLLFKNEENIILAYLLESKKFVDLNELDRNFLYLIIDNNENLNRKVNILNRN